MWWPTPQESRLTGSASAQNILRTYEAFDGFESFAFTFLLKAFGEDVGSDRYALPEGSFTRPLRGPQEQMLAFSASQEKGLRLHFDRLNTPASYRDEIWRMFAEFAEAFRRILIKQNAEPDAPAEVRPLDWWTLCRQAVETTESTGQTVKIVGAVVVK